MSSSRSVRSQSLVCVVVMVACITFAYVTNIDKFHVSIVKALIHVLFQSILLFGLVVTLNVFKPLKWLVVLFLGIVFFTHLAYQAPLSISTIFSVFNAPTEESASFVAEHGWEILSTVFWVIVLALLSSSIPASKWWRRSLYAGSIYLLLPFLVQIPKVYSGNEFADYINKGTARGYSYSYTAAEYTIHKLSLRFPTFQSVIAIKDSVSLMTLQTENAATWTNVEVSTEAPKVLVIGIGESLRAGNMSLYGYERKTTPKLDAIKSQLTVVNQPYAAGSNTWGSIPAMLTKTGNMPNFSQSIILLAKAAGYQTFWLSNQAQFGQWDFSISTLAQQADTQYFASKEEGGALYDDVLIEQLSAALEQRSQRKLIILHFYGSHMNFSDRYPADFDSFSSGDKRLDQYDNSVLYTDFLQAEIIEMVKKAGGEYVFFSDHGLGSPHGDLPLKHDVRTPPDIESLYVPFFFTGNRNIPDINHQPFSLFYFECFFSSWSGITTEDLSEEYCGKSVNNDFIVYMDSNMAVRKQGKPELVDNHVAQSK
ncbi:sulfatase-like hydrolase/transferase [Vibrio campbellii]|uniref:sulfatase-like hydrolase/transferase n=2 Tax=Vibrio campbellii TaxID=680 RepID=UPI0005EE8940|nr:sulfatase-like hydrolase/transferase [Vibrio campbellii]